MILQEEKAPRDLSCTFGNQDQLHVSRRTNQRRRADHHSPETPVTLSFGIDRILDSKYSTRKGDNECRKISQDGELSSDDQPGLPRVSGGEARDWGISDKWPSSSTTYPTIHQTESMNEPHHRLTITANANSASQHAESTDEPRDTHTRCQDLGLQSSSPGLQCSLATAPHTYRQVSLPASSAASASRSCASTCISSPTCTAPAVDPGPAWLERLRGADSGVVADGGILQTTQRPAWGRPPPPTLLFPWLPSHPHRLAALRRAGHPYQNRTPPKRKKPRTSFSRQQIVELEKRFHRQKYLASAERSSLAKQLKMTDAQVKTWFQNRRTKWRRQTAEEREMEQQAAHKFLKSLKTEQPTPFLPPFLPPQPSAPAVLCA